ncbi:MAG: ABC transporter transmembrane domain-containing protein, partial [Alphaproteobacteria bacterium]
MTSVQDRRQDLNGAARPPRAVVGSQISRDEEMFGALFDRGVVSRFIDYVRPYRRRVLLAVAAVLIATGAQLAIPLVVRYGIDSAILGADRGAAMLLSAVAVFAAVIAVNYAATWLQDRIIAVTGEQVIFDLRYAMFAHLQHVALSFMDKTEVGRMMSRLQGDVNALQEFLENSITVLGDLVLLFGIIAIMLVLDFELGIVTLSVVPTLLVLRVVWLPRAREAFRRARETNAIANGALAEGIHAVRTVQGMRREAVNFDLYDDKARENLKAHLTAAKYAQIMVPAVDTLTGAAMG